MSIFNPQSSTGKKVLVTAVGIIAWNLAPDEKEPLAKPETSLDQLTISTRRSDFVLAEQNDFVIDLKIKSVKYNLPPANRATFFPFEKISSDNISDQAALKEIYTEAYPKLSENIVDNLVRLSTFFNQMREKAGLKEKFAITPLCLGANSKEFDQQLSNSALLSTFCESLTVLERSKADSDTTYSIYVDAGSTLKKTISGSFDNILSSAAQEIILKSVCFLEGKTENQKVGRYINHKHGDNDTAVQYSAHFNLPGFALLKDHTPAEQTIIAMKLSQLKPEEIISFFCMSAIQHFNKPDAKSLPEALLKAAK